MEWSGYGQYQDHLRAAVIPLYTFSSSSIFLSFNSDSAFVICFASSSGGTNGISAFTHVRCLLTAAIDKGDCLGHVTVRVCVFM